MRYFWNYALLAATMSAAIVSIDYAYHRTRALYREESHELKLIPYSEREKLEETIHSMRTVECGFQDNPRGEWSYGCWMVDDEWWRK